jgi:hypothetical protein
MSCVCESEELSSEVVLKRSLQDDNVLLTGPSGCGKSLLSSGIGLAGFGSLPYPEASRDLSRMLSAVNQLSGAEICVAYHFRNLTSQDVEGTVAFPMPDIRVTESDAFYPDGPPDNPMRFSVTVDGRALPVQLEKKAKVGSKDITETLRSLGLPLEPYSD